MKPTLGSDYSGSHIYLGVITEHSVVSVADVDITHPKSGIDALRSTFKDYNLRWGIDKIWAEEAWVNGMRFPKSGIMLSRTSAFIEIAALDTDLQVEFVHPSTWRKTVYGHAKPANPKDVARAYVKQLFDYEIKLKKDHNTAEAILLALYGRIQNND
jgi:Holliday junction resolvasome RuvABC endonuclease subunit